MSFDPATAEPVAAQSGFDPDSAKPVEDSGFDVSTAKPVEGPDEPPEDTTRISGEQWKKTFEDSSGDIKIGRLSLKLSRLKLLLSHPWDKYSKSVDEGFKGPLEIPRVEAGDDSGALNRTKQVGAAGVNTASGAVSGLVSPGGALSLLQPQTVVYSAPRFIVGGFDKLLNLYRDAKYGKLGDKPVQERAEELIGGGLMIAGGAHGLKAGVAGARGGLSSEKPPATPGEAVKLLHEEAAEEPHPEAKQVLEAAAGHIEETAKGPAEFDPETAKPVAEAPSAAPEAPAEAFDPETARPVVPEDPHGDFNRYQQIDARMRELVSSGETQTQEFRDLWRENEDIKNRNSSDPGNPPEPIEAPQGAAHGELFGDETPFNLSGGEAAGPVEHAAPEPQAELLAPGEGRSTAPTALDIQNEHSRAMQAEPEETDFGGETMQPTGKPLSPADRARMRAEETDAAKPEGPELLEAVKGMLPHPEDDPMFHGELKTIWDNLVEEKKVAAKMARKGKGEKVLPARKGYTMKDTAKAREFFAERRAGGAKAGITDGILDSLREKGFDFKTPSDLFEAIELSTKGAKKFYGAGGLDQMDTGEAAPPIAVSPEAAAKSQGKVLDAMKARADAARERIAARLEGKFTLGAMERPKGKGLVTPENIADFAEIGAYHLARGVTDAVQWSKEMVKEFGEKIRPYLGVVRAQAEKIHGENDPGAAKNYGIAARVSAERAEGGHIAPIEPGVVRDPESIVQHGRNLLQSGYEPREALDNFARTKMLSVDAIALVRAHGEELAKAANEAMEKHGVGSAEYDAAAKADSDWTAAVKPMQTAWAEMGRAQQGETEVDTGTFHGLRRAFIEDTGKDFTPEQAGAAIKVARKVKHTMEAADAATKEVIEGIKKETAKMPKGEPSPEVFSLADRISIALEKQAQAALKRIKARMAEGRMYSIGADPEVLADYIAYGASKLAKGAVDFSQWSAEMVRDLGKQIQPHLKELWDKANSELDRQVERSVSPGRRRAVKKVLTETTKEVREAKRSSLKVSPLIPQEGNLEMEQKQTNIPGIEQPPLLADNPMKKGGEIRGNAEEQGKQTGLPGVDKPAVTPDVATGRGGAVEGNAEEQAKQAGLEGIEKPAIRPDVSTRRTGEVVGDAREQAKQTKLPLKEAGVTPSDVWNLAKQYVDEGETDYESMRHKIAADLGISVEDVTRELARPKDLSRMTDEMYQKLAARRNAIDDAKNFLKEQKTPGWERFIRSVPKAFFAAKVFGHGTVGMITHAGLNVFDPGAWKTYWPNFFRQFKLLGWHDKGAFHERMMQDLVRDENFTLGRRSGLANDPRRYTDDYQSNWLGKYFNRVGLTGNRGFDALKLFRQARFNQIWEQMPHDLRTPDMAKMIADEVNHATGVVRMRFREWANWTFFAPKLEGSRWAWMIGDPVKAGRILGNWKEATPEERMFAMRQVKQKAIIAGTYLGLLATNQGLLSMVGSKQSINYTNPRRGDFLSFKVGGYNFGVVGPMLGMVRLLANLLHASVGTRTPFEQASSSRSEQSGKVAWDYFRGKLSPFASFAEDMRTQADFRGRPLPFSQEKVPASLRRQGIGPYTYGEYAAEQFAPIPVSEAIREIWKKQGMDESTIEHWMKALTVAVTMGGTGAKLSEDAHIGEPSAPPPRSGPMLHRRGH